MCYARFMQREVTKNAAVLIYFWESTDIKHGPGMVHKERKRGVFQKNHPTNTEVTLSRSANPSSTRCHSWAERRRARSGSPHAGRLPADSPAGPPVPPPQPFPPPGSSQDGGGPAPRGRCPGARPPAAAGCMTAAVRGEGGGAGGGRALGREPELEGAG